MKMRSTLLITGFSFILFSCGSGNNESNSGSASDSTSTSTGEMNMDNMSGNNSKTEGNIAFAQLSSKSGSSVTGLATFSDKGDGKVDFRIEIEGATPGNHGVHLHENGDCSAEDASSAGGHWNPTGDTHGERAEGKYHAGDIDNIEVGEDGKGVLEMEVTGWSVGGSGESDILGHSVVVHAGEDDFTSQPSGDSGSRVACGVIEERE